MTNPTVHIDFETYSEADLKTVGAFRYAEDPSTEALLLGYAIGNAPPVVVDLTVPGYFERLSPLFRAIEAGSMVAAHNAIFEWQIWTKVCSFPVGINMSQWDCTAARARLIALPGGLDRVAEILGVDQRKDPMGLKLINLFCKPGKGGKRVYPRDNPEAFESFKGYCAQDIVVEREIDNILPPIPAHERAIFELDMIINERGFPVNLEAVQSAHNFIQEYSETLRGKALNLSGCRPTQRAKTMEFLSSRGINLDNLQKGTVDQLVSSGQLPPDISALLSSRLELTKAGTKKLKTILDCVSADGRVRGGFLYCGATTRRWSSKGVQLHNLQKNETKSIDPDTVLDIVERGGVSSLSELYDSPLTALAESIRGFFQSEMGFNIADYASIEPRSLAWAADERWLVQAYADRQDAYKLTAGKAFGVDPLKVTPEQRFLGKQLVLGCGYQMGPERFIGSCKRFGVDITEEMAKESVYGFRKSVKKIEAFWGVINDSATKAVRFDTEIRFLGRFGFKPVYLPNGYRLLKLEMPQGEIFYPEPRAEDIVWKGEKKRELYFKSEFKGAFRETYTFGGSLTENLIQSLTRNLLRDGMVQAERDGFSIVAHTHDEAIDEGPEDRLKEFERVLCSSSPWAEGIPIATEGFHSKRYKK